MAQSLYYSLNANLNKSNYSNNKDIYNDIWDNLVKTFSKDLHWAYKTFIDVDFDPIRGQYFTYTKYIPCPGDCCPEFYYFFNKNGTVDFYSEYPDLSGILENATGTAVKKRNGIHVLVLFQGKNKYLYDLFPSYYIEISDSEASTDYDISYESFIIYKNNKGEIESLN